MRPLVIATAALLLLVAVRAPCEPWCEHPCEELNGDVAYGSSAAGSGRGRFARLLGTIRSQLGMSELLPSARSAACRRPGWRGSF